MANQYLIEVEKLWVSTGFCARVANVPLDVQTFGNLPQQTTQQEQFSSQVLAKGTKTRKEWATPPPPPPNPGLSLHTQKHAHAEREGG